MPTSDFEPTLIPDLYGPDRFGLSIEVFPPKTAKGDATLFATLDTLSEFDPGFISCTYGAGGSTQARTVEICVEIQKRYRLTATSHFTCVGATREQLHECLSTLAEKGIRNIMALRGDPPKGETTFQAVEGGLRYANELVELIREDYPDCGIGVAGYPEKHAEAPDHQTDLDNLKRKVDAGADAVYTQLFYINENFFDFRERAERAGITVPIIPGIMPVTEFRRIERIAAMCEAIFPPELSGPLEAAQDDLDAQFEIGVEYAIRQCRELLDAGVPGFHFYALNRSHACDRILTALGLGGSKQPAEQKTSAEP